MNCLRLVFIGVALFWITSCNSKHTLFEKISSSHSGITFNNKITENDSINPLDVVNIYNGGGVGIGDFNNDGLADIYLTGNMVPCKLYLNKGDFKFEDITAEAGVDGMGRWARGVSIVDINNDGLADIYVCNTIYNDSLRRQNILYVNQGPDKDGVPHFKDEAREYGLDIHVQSTMAHFFDYDNDGDLDMYLVVNEASTGYNSSVFQKRHESINNAPNKGRLFRNEMDSAHHHVVYHDVSDAAGIVYSGYGHAATICDINNDGWKDIYVSDDFLSNNLLYINNHNGTFTESLKEYFKHTSYNSMGQDVVDINNDGLADVIELDMNPEDNFRKKMMLMSNNYLTYQNFDAFGYHYQFVRNTLQINQGPGLRENDTVGIPVFSDIGFLSGIAQTDWSWSPLVTDMNNDGYRDIVITNGFPRDVSDHDFMAYRQKATNLQPKMDMLKEIPQVKLHNYAFQNAGPSRSGISFSDESTSWGLTVPTFSNGIAYADFDNDGALDMIINNINDEALLYKNTLHQKDTASAHYLQVKCKGGPQNINGLGALIAVYYDHNKKQVYENNPYRGYLSTMQGLAHFGLANISLIDSVVVKWYNGMQQTIRNVKADQVLTVNIADAKDPYSPQGPVIESNTLFSEVTSASGITYKHNEPDCNDFLYQAMLPHKLSEYCPALAAGDLNGDGLDDMVIGGNTRFPTQKLIQQPGGKFLQSPLMPGEYEDGVNKGEGILLFDANGDGKTDVYVASGGYEQVADNTVYQDRLYINDGKGNFNKDTSGLPSNHSSKLCIRAMDINHDGKLDLFVSGRVMPRNYPKPVSSFIFRNDSDKDHVKFTEVTNEVAPDLKDIGMICDALFTDFDDDGQTDLIVVGEWMPITFLKNTNGKFKNVTASTGLQGQTGWWNSIVAGDFRHTGRTDYIIGNTGTNTLYKANDQYPVYITAKDFDSTGAYIPIPSLFLPDERGVRKEYPAESRDDVARQMVSIKRRFTSYKAYAHATMDEIITPQQRKGAIRMQANTLQSCFLRNDGNGKYTLTHLPDEAQFSAINGMVVDDFDDDGNLDVILNANDYGTEVGTGRYDAMNGLLLKGNGNGSFTPLSIMQSGIFIPGNGKALVKLQGASGKYLVAASQNHGPLKLFECKAKAKQIKLRDDDIIALVKYKDNKVQKEECYYGNSFLSQSSRFLRIGNNVSSVEIKNSKGEKKTISF